MKKTFKLYIIFLLFFYFIYCQKNLLILQKNKIVISPTKGIANTLFYFSIFSNTGAFYQWDFDGDGNFDTDISRTNSFFHVYYSEGEFYPSVLIIDYIGNRSFLSSKLSVLAITNNYSNIAIFNYKPYRPNIDTGVILDARASKGINGSLNIEFSWTRDGNFLSNKALITDRPLQAGVYLYSLKIIDKAEYTTNLTSKTIYIDYAREDYFASKLYDYQPAPGQFINDPNYALTNSQKILGPPHGGGLLSGTKDVVSLGTGGGYVIIGFNSPIKNDPRNILGYDFIVFGNAFFYTTQSNALPFFSEPAVVYVACDDNSNSIPDDKWYLLKPGDYETNNQIVIEYSLTNSNLKPENKNYYPSNEIYDIEPDIELKFYLSKITSLTEMNGYADMCPVLKLGDLSGSQAENYDSTMDQEDNIYIEPWLFYSYPDHPGDSIIDPKSCGGDAFDISHAIMSNGMSINLTSISFIKIVSAITDSLGVFGELSPEIDAVSRVRISNY